MNGSLIRNLALLVLLAVGTGCAPSPVSPTVHSGYLKAITTKGYIAHQGDDLDQLANQVVSQTEYALARQVSVNRYDLFNKGGSFFQRWPNGALHRAIAIGSPERCGMKYAWTGQNSPQDAIVAALKGCLQDVGKMSKTVGTPCGCKVAAWDQNVLVDPVDLSYRQQSPALAMITPKGGHKGQEILGYIQYDGTVRSGPMSLSFYNMDKKLICEGHFELDQETLSGAMSLSCFDGQIKGEGTFKTDGIRQGRTYGTAQADTDGEKILVVYGLSDADARVKTKELLGGQ